MAVRVGRVVASEGEAPDRATAVGRDRVVIGAAVTITGAVARRAMEHRAAVEVARFAGSRPAGAGLQSGIDSTPSS